MECYLGVLEDDELSHLSERMTPVEFDRIALQYLKLKKVGKVWSKTLRSKVFGLINGGGINGGHKFECTGLNGGHDFSARKSENPTAPRVHINNDRSLSGIWHDQTSGLNCRMQPVLELLPNSGIYWSDLHSFPSPCYIKMSTATVIKVYSFKNSYIFRLVLTSSRRMLAETVSITCWLHYTTGETVKTQTMLEESSLGNYKLQIRPLQIDSLFLIIFY